MYSTSKIDATNLMKQMGFNINPYEVNLINKKNKEKTQVVNTYISVHGCSRSYLTSISIDNYTEDMSSAEIRATYSINVEKDTVNYTFGLNPDKSSSLIKDINKIEDYMLLLVVLSNKSFKTSTIDIKANISFKEKIPVISEVEYSIRSEMFNYAIKDNSKKLKAIDYIDEKLIEHNLNYSREFIKDIAKVFEMLVI